MASIGGHWFNKNEKNENLDKKGGKRTRVIKGNGLSVLIVICAPDRIKSARDSVLVWWESITSPTGLYQKGKNMSTVDSG